MTTQRSSLFAIAALAFVVACGDPVAPNLDPTQKDTTSKTRKPGPPANASLVGDPIDTTVASSVVVTVRVTDSIGIVVPNRLVNFIVVSGGGSVYAGSALTSDSGVAKEIWTLGKISGVQIIEARAVDSSTGDPIMLGKFSANARPGPATSLRFAFSDVTYIVGTGERIADLAKITTGIPKDAYGNVVDLARIRYTATGVVSISSDSIVATAPGRGTLNGTIDNASAVINARAVDDLRIGVLSLSARCINGPGMTVDSVTLAMASENVAYLNQSGNRAAIITASIPFRGKVTTWNHGTAPTIADRVDTLRVQQQPDSITGFLKLGGGLSNTTTISYGVASRAPLTYTGTSMCGSGYALRDSTRIVMAK